MARREKVWVPAGGQTGRAGRPGGRADPKPPPHEKAAITEACERFIQERLIPRFLPEIRPQTEFNFPVAIHGKWLGNKYRFMTRYQCAGPNRTADAFDAPFARLAYIRHDCFDLHWHRHTGTWHPIRRNQTLNDALREIAESGIFMPC